MNWDSILVVLCIVAALAFLGYRHFSRRGGCGCGCSCDASGGSHQSGGCCGGGDGNCSCGEGGLDDLRRKR